jgi:hypothetical protein
MPRDGESAEDVYLDEGTGSLKHFLDSRTEEKLSPKRERYLTSDRLTSDLPHRAACPIV